MLGAPLPYKRLSDEACNMRYSTSLVAAFSLFPLQVPRWGQDLLFGAGHEAVDSKSVVE